MSETEANRLLIELRERQKAFEEQMLRYAQEIVSVRKRLIALLQNSA
jgi:recombinational DNA repair ATPase RecF